MSKNLYLTLEHFKKEFPKSKLCKKMKKRRMWKVKKVGEKDNKREILYLNIPMAFDIETTSFYEGGKTGNKAIDKERKRGIMYMWQCAIEDTVIVLRTWEEWSEFRDFLYTELSLSEDKRIVFYVHNLAYEFAFLRKRHKWVEIFAREERKPMYAADDMGFEFRCSYTLTGKALKSIGEELGDDYHKLDGEEFDYRKVRNCLTPLSDYELEYGIMDVLILTKLIEQKIQQDGDITKIPLTKTGYVRRYCRKHCMYTDGKPNHGYRTLMKQLTLTPDEYELAKEVYTGGFTHASCLNEGRTHTNCKSKDFTSSYPASAFRCGFPMSKGEYIGYCTQGDLNRYIDDYCCMFTVKLKNVDSKFDFEHIISESKCLTLSDDAVIDNGRVVSASELSISITEIDWKWINYTYKFDRDDVEIKNLWIYRRGYLPKEMLECFLHFYVGKTELKGLKSENGIIITLSDGTKIYDAEQSYALLKENLNSAYGMMVTDIVSDDVELSTDGEWKSEHQKVEKRIEEENESSQRFTSYLWGIYICKISMHNLFLAIFTELKEDYCYSDTDSVKYKNWEIHEPYFEKYNKMNDKIIEDCLEHYNLDKNLYRPKNRKGEECPLGEWSDEGVLDKCKFLCAKRYIYKQNGEWHLTVAGTGKHKTMEYLIKKYESDDEILRHFNTGLEIPAEWTGKSTHTYIDYQTVGYIEDYLGNVARYNEFTSVHMEECPFKFGMSDDYVDYLECIHGVREVLK